MFSYFSYVVCFFRQPVCDFNLRFVLGNLIRREDAAPVDAGVDDGPATEDAAGVEHAVAAHFRAVADERTKFTKTCVD